MQSHRMSGIIESPISLLNFLDIVAYPGVVCLPFPGAVNLLNKEASNA
jgi:hypothetical protein